MLGKKTNPFPGLVSINDFSPSEKTRYLHFVLEGLLPLLTTHKRLNPTRAAAIAQINRRVQLRLVLIGEDTGLLQEHFTVITVGVPPLQILTGGLLQMQLNVLQGMLLDVPDPKVRVLFHLSALGDGFTSQHLDEGRLSGTVSTNDSHSGRQRERERRIGQGWLVGAGIRVAAVGHTHNGASVGLDTGQDTRGRELELDDTGGKSVVTLGFGLDFDEAARILAMAMTL